MALAPGLTCGLSFLPKWLAETHDATRIQQLLTEWVRCLGWNKIGLVLQRLQQDPLVIAATSQHAEVLPQPPAESADVHQGFASGVSTLVWQLHGSSGRLYTQVTLPGRGSGLLWAEKNDDQPWSDAEREYLHLAARLMERSPAVIACIGPVVDPERLQQRLGDAAVIAGRMAHDFDNILTGIIGFADLTLPLVQQLPQASRFVGEISKVGQRGITFTQQLHQLSRSGQVKPQPGSVAMAITREETRLKPSMPAGVRLEQELPESLAPVAMEIGPLQAVLGHLLENAFDASAQNSTVRVQARTVELNPDDCKVYLGQVGPGAHVEITVQDHGSGIKPEVRARLFVEPFYTTKVRHRGLGLAIVYRILLAHRGGIQLLTGGTSGPGTTVQIVIPMAAARPPVQPAYTSTTHGSSSLGG